MSINVRHTTIGMSLLAAAGLAAGAIGLESAQASGDATPSAIGCSTTPSANANGSGSASADGGASNTSNPANGIAARGGGGGGNTVSVGTPTAPITLPTVPPAITHPRPRT